MPPSVMSDDRDHDAEDSLSDSIDRSVSSPPTTSVTSASRPSTQVRTRITVVCAECKRLKLKCDRRTPCGSCVKRETVKRCTYSAAASEKVDVQSVHNAQISQSHLIAAIFDFLGVSEDEREFIMNAQSYPPSNDFTLGVNVRNLRKLFLQGPSTTDEDDGPAVRPTGPNNITAGSGPGGNSRKRKHLAGGSVAPGVGQLAEGAFIAFAQPPSQIAPLDLPNRFGHAPSPVTSARKHQSTVAGRTSATDAGSIRMAMARTALDLATQIFQANSTVVAAGVASAFRLWCEDMGWEPKAIHTSALPNSLDPGRDSPASDGAQGEDTVMSNPSRREKDVEGRPKKTKNVIPLVAPPSELDYHDTPRPKDVSALGLAYRLFVGPAIATSVVSPSAPSTHATSGPNSPFPFTFSYGVHSPPMNPAPGSTGTPTAQPGPSGSPSFHHQPSTSAPATNTSTSSHPTPPVSSPSTHSTLVTASLILSHLPTGEWRQVLWSEFESVMLVHEGTNGTGRGLLKQRIDSMFEWAESVNEKEKGGDDSASVVSSASSRHSATRAAKIRSTRSATRAAQNARGPPPPPTLSFFAVACAAYALGALSYACRTAHGFSGNERRGTPPTESRTLGEEGELETMSMASSVLAMPPPGGLSHPGHTADSSSNPGSGGSAETAKHHRSGDRMDTSLSDDATPKFDPTTQFLPTAFAPHTLHSLARACIIAHDTLDLPPSLDYLYAHTLGWIYLLHPSESLSSVTDSGFDSAARGLAGGSVTVIEPLIWKELGKCVNVARGMGLGSVDAKFAPTVKKGAGADERAEEGEPGEDEDSVGSVGVWEKEMRRRVWWELSYFDLYISDCMGQAPLIEDTTRTCKMPSDVDESMFDPTSTSLPEPYEEGEVGQSLSHFVMKCRLLTLLKEFRHQSFRDPKTNELSIESANAFEARVLEWQENLPSRFSIKFGQSIEETSFPHSESTAIQACDLHIMANLLLMKLWYPFFRASLASSQANQNASAVACATAANNVIIASQHLMNRFKFRRPLSFGFYGFGRAVWLAATFLASTLIASPHILFASAARRSLDVAIILVRDQVVGGKSNATTKQKYEVRLLLEHLRMMADRVSGRGLPGGAVAGSKRKSGNHVETVKMRYGFQIPYVGASLVSAPGELDIVYAPHQTFPGPNVVKHNTPTPGEESDATSSSVHPPSEGPSRKGASRKASQVWTTEPPVHVPASAEHVIGAANGEYVPPAAASAFPPALPPISRNRPRTGSIASQSQSSQSTGSNLVRPLPARARPAIGIRDRSRMNQKAHPTGAEASGSTTEKARNSDSSSAPSKPKRPKSSSYDHHHHTPPPSSGASASSAPAPSRGVLQSPLASQPSSASMKAHLNPSTPVGSPGLVGGSMPPPPIQQTAAPQPTYYHPPRNPTHTHPTSGDVPMLVQHPQPTSVHFSAEPPAGPVSGTPVNHPPVPSSEFANPRDYHAFQAPPQQDYSMSIDVGPTAQMYHSGPPTAVSHDYGASASAYPSGDGRYGFGSTSDYGGGLAFDHTPTPATAASGLSSGLAYPGVEHGYGVIQPQLQTHTPQQQEHSYGASQSYGHFASYPNVGIPPPGDNSTHQGGTRQTWNGSSQSSYGMFDGRT
ncbi:hypothetical protein FRB99_005615 [Tulasnella sp. 403]|nr:hypothetical protein FRB99_005615 [Tulasnella sp. 403]